MFVGSLGVLSRVLSQFWILGFGLIVAAFLGRYVFKRISRENSNYILQWGCLLTCVGYAWQSLNQILLGVLDNGELDIGIGMGRFLLITFPVLLIQIILFLRRDFSWVKQKSGERIKLYLLGGGIIAAFYTAIAAYKLADVNTLTNCLYVAPPGYEFKMFNDWARDLCR